MDKKQVKLIQITDVIRHQLDSIQDYSGEYTTHCNIDFMLDTPCCLQIFDTKITIDRIKMLSIREDIGLVYADDKKVYPSLPITKTIAGKVYDRVRQEQKDGVLKGWRLDYYIFEMLTG